MGELIFELLGDLVGDVLWDKVIRPGFRHLIRRPIRWAIVRPIQRLRAARRFRRDLEAHRDKAAAVASS